MVLFFLAGMNNSNVPNHLAVVIDGNRRWARGNGMLHWMGHKKGIKNLDDFLDWCFDLGIKQVSAYVLSIENLKRSRKEVEELFRLFSEWLERYLKKESGFFDKHEVRIKFIGDLGRLPKRLIGLMEKLMIRTAKYQKKVLNILVAYGSHFELTETFNKIAEKIIEKGGIEITEKDIEKNLSVPTQVDLVIRTGGRSRLSNLLLWQAAYAEIYVTDTLWPDFSKQELMKAIEWFNSEQRNFGK